MMQAAKTVKLIVVGVSTSVIHLRLKTDGRSISGINASIEWCPSGSGEFPEPAFHGWALGDEVELTLQLKAHGDST